tara:strand:- start:251 stop:445 length:195 start_codon:yes stop_codon:yes gene_type:complete
MSQVIVDPNRVLRQVKKLLQLPNGSPDLLRELGYVASWAKDNEEAMYIDSRELRALGRFEIDTK